MTVIKRTAERDAAALAAIQAATGPTELGINAAACRAIVPKLLLHKQNGIRYLRAMAIEGLCCSARAKVGTPMTETYYFLTHEAMHAFWSAYQLTSEARNKARIQAANRAAGQRRIEARAAMRLLKQATKPVVDYAAIAARQARLAEQRAAKQAAAAQARRERDEAAKARAEQRAIANAAAKAAAKKVRDAKAAKKAGAPGRLPIGCRPTKRDDGEAWQIAHRTPARAAAKPDPIIPEGLQVHVEPCLAQYRHTVTGPIVGGLATKGIGHYLEPASGWAAAVCRQAANDSTERAAA